MKRFFLRLFVALLFVLCLYSICMPAALPTSDLASQSQEVRDTAAKVLRAKAKPPWKIKWLVLTTPLKVCKTETNVLELLKAYNVKPEPGLIWGSLSEFAEYQLDDYWMLGCEYDSDTKALIRWKLLSSWRNFYLQPATNFSGIWVTYFANGQKSSEANYQDGKLAGELISFRPDGSRNSVWHYDHGKANGLWTQYYPSGQIQFECQYSNSVRVGDRVFYNESGSKRSIVHYDNGKENGLCIVYFPSGKVESQCQYSNDVKVGLEVRYNEDGTTNSVKDSSKP